MDIDAFVRFSYSHNGRQIVWAIRWASEKNAHLLLHHHHTQYTKYAFTHSIASWIATAAAAAKAMPIFAWKANWWCIIERTLNTNKLNLGSSPPAYSPPVAHIEHHLNANDSDSNLTHYYLLFICWIRRTKRQTIPFILPFLNHFVLAVSHSMHSTVGCYASWRQFWFEVPQGAITHHNNQTG